MSNAAKLKKRAVELEQKKQFDKALALYIQFLDESEGALDDIDVPLYNRVGDLMLRTGNASDALNYYEKAVDLYAERGFLNNAIALCNKVLRQSPGRASIYYKLGKISATKGFKSDAKKNFLEYADRMQKAGQIDEAFRALKEFADLCPDQDDIRLMLAEQLTKENRSDEAMEQLQKLHDKLDSEGRTAEARATVDRMKSIDPEAVPRVSGSYRPQKTTDLIFLDTSYEQQARMRDPAPTAPPPPGRPLSDADLVALTLDQVSTPASPIVNHAVVEELSLDAGVPNETSAGVDLPMLDVGEALPSVSELEDAFELAEPAPVANAEPAVITPLEFELPTESAAAPAIDLDPTPATVDAADGANQTSTFLAGPPLTVDYAGDLANDAMAMPEPTDGGLFDFRAPPRSENDVASSEPSVSLDPDVAFPSFDLDDTSLPSADEVTSGANLAAALEDDATLGIESGDTDTSSAEPIVEMAPRDAVADAERHHESAEDLDLEWTSTAEAAATHQPDASMLAANIDDLIIADAEHSEAAAAPARENPAEPNEDSVAPDELLIAASPERADTPPAAAAYFDFPIDDLIEVPESEESVVGAAEPEIEEPTPVSQAIIDVEVVAEPVVEPSSLAQTPEAVPSIDQDDESADRRENWEIQRDRAEGLLEDGDRAGGIKVLEEAATELERGGDLERSLTIVDELIRLSPDSIRHHQKRVELAFRSNDRVKLIDAYLELGDALFRSGEERKARAVYQRVLELAPDDPRARSAVESVASISNTASGSMAAISPTPRPADVRQESGPPARDPRAPAQQPSAGNGARPAGGISAPAQSRKPSPLDRAAASSDFVDLGEWLRSGDSPKSTRMVAEEKPPTGDEQADFAEMLKRFKQGVAENVDDEDFESHYDLGVAYKEMGLMDEAVAEFQKALRGSTNRVRSYEALGQCFVEKEQYQVAASVLSRAIALGEGDDHHLVGVLYLLGRATEALSRERDALDYYQRVFAVDIEFRDVTERISAIERKAT